MGNTSSSDKKSLEHIVNYLAAQYITKDEFKNMINLKDQEYCDKLIILTSKIFKEYLNPSMIEYLSVKKGIEGDNITKKDKILAIEKDKLDKINIKEGYKRERLCKGLAKFYIQIAHIFAAISSTLNPQYKFTDLSNNEIEKSIMDREDLPNYKERIITRNNLCSNRLKILLGSMDYNDLLDDTIIKINPNFCDLNSNEKTLNDEPGIPELKELYNDKYNYNLAQFDDMTPKMKKIYEKDLKTLFDEFSNGDEKFDPDKIKNFSDIKLKDFHNSKGCKSELYKEKIVGSTKKFLFKKYVDNIKEMIENIKTQNNELLKIIDKIFVFSIDSNTGNKKIIINKNLNVSKLSEITEETRNAILKLYTNCEKHFIEGLEIYEALIKKLKLQTTTSQINNLKQEINEKIPETDTSELDIVKENEDREKTLDDDKEENEDKEKTLDDDDEEENEDREKTIHDDKEENEDREKTVVDDKEENEENEDREKTVVDDKEENEDREKTVDDDKEENEDKEKTVDDDKEENEDREKTVNDDKEENREDEEMNKYNREFEKDKI